MVIILAGFEHISSLSDTRLNHKRLTRLSSCESVTLGALDTGDHELAVMQGGANGKWDWGVNVEEDSQSSGIQGGVGDESGEARDRTSRSSLISSRHNLLVNCSKYVSDRSRSKEHSVVGQISPEKEPLASPRRFV